VLHSEKSSEILSAHNISPDRLIDVFLVYVCVYMRGTKEDFQCGATAISYVRCPQIPYSLEAFRSTFSGRI
jgi:hypothetical protein